MTQVELVALWSGLIASVVSIALSIVAIVFALWVNTRADRVNKQTIESLRRIEGLTEDMSRDIKELIKSAWDAMLFSPQVNSSSSSFETQREGENEVVAGLVSEMQSQLQEGSAQSLETLRQLIDELRETVRQNSGSDDREQRLSEIRAAVRTLPPETVELARQLSRGHLDRDQYRELLRKSPLASSLRRLRQRKLLVPLTGTTPDGNEVPVYWFPPDKYELIQAALLVAPDPPADVRDEVRRELERVNHQGRIT